MLEFFFVVVICTVYAWCVGLAFQASWLYAAPLIIAGLAFNWVMQTSEERDATRAWWRQWL